MHGSHKWETHLHTSEGSACAHSTGAEMARAHLAAGYEGIIVTDHFFNGNCAVPGDLPWEERVARFCAGYEHARIEGERIGLRVLFGLEFSFRGTDFLTYGIDRGFLLAHPGMDAWEPATFFSEIHRAGGFIAHAHPFRTAFYISEIRLYPEGVDAVEIENASHSDPDTDRQAHAFALRHKLLMTAGSDTHDDDRLFGGGMRFHHAIGSIGDFIAAVRNRQWDIPGSGR